MKTLGVSRDGGGVGHAVGRGHRGDVSHATSYLYSSLHMCKNMCTHTHTPVYFLQESRHETLVLPSDTSDPPVSDKLHGSYMGLSDSSVGKGSACNAGDPSWIPGWGRSSGEGIGYPLQYSWASLVAQLVKNPPAMQETWVGSLGWEDPLEKGKATHSSNLAWRIPWTV